MPLIFSEIGEVSLDSFDAEFSEPENFGEEGEYLVISRNLYQTKQAALDFMQSWEWDGEYNLAQFSPSDLDEGSLEWGKVAEANGDFSVGDWCYRVRMQPYDDTLGALSLYALPVWILNTRKEPSVNV
jgi:hypothetical protein